MAKGPGRDSGDGEELGPQSQPGGQLTTAVMTSLLPTEESASARVLTAGEPRMLSIVEDVPVLCSGPVDARRMERDRQPVEAATIIVSTGSTALDDTINLA